VIATSGAISSRSLGLACSLLPTHRREIGREIERKNSPGKDSVHFGEEKKRVVLTATVLYLRHLENEWGTKVLHTFITAEGNIAKWFCSNTSNALEQGKKYVIKATVKKHEEYKGRKETLLTRVAVESVCEQEQENDNATS